MTMTRLTICTFVLTAVASVVATAQTPVSQGRTGGPPVQGAEEDIPLVSRFDRNGDKVLERARESTASGKG